MLDHPWRTGLIIGTTAGLAAALFAISAAWQHNPQNEIHGPAGVSWRYWLLIGVTWVIPIGLPAAMASAALLHLRLLARRLTRRYS